MNLSFTNLVSLFLHSISDKMIPPHAVWFDIHFKVAKDIRSSVLHTVATETTEMGLSWNGNGASLLEADTMRKVSTRF